MPNPLVSDHTRRQAHNNDRRPRYAIREQEQAEAKLWEQRQPSFPPTIEEVIAVQGYGKLRRGR